MQKKLTALIDCHDAPPSMAAVLRGEPLASLSYGGSFRMIDFPLSALDGFCPVGLLGEGCALSRCADRSGARFFRSIAAPGDPGFPLFPLEDCRAFWADAAVVLLCGCRCAVLPDPSVLCEALGTADAALLFAPDGGGAGPGYTVRLESDGRASLRAAACAAQNRFLGWCAVRHEALEAMLSLYGELFSALCSGRWKLTAVPGPADAADVSDPPSYFAANLRLPDSGFPPRLRRFSGEAGPPALCGPSVRRSILSAGCRIEGAAEDCVFAEGAVVETGAALRQCILLPGSRVARGCRIQNAVLAPGAAVPPETELRGRPEYPYLVR